MIRHLGMTILVLVMGWVAFAVAGQAGVLWLTAVVLLAAAALLALSRRESQSFWALERLLEPLSASLDTSQIVFVLLRATMKLTQATAVTFARRTDDGRFWVARLQNGEPTSNVQTDVPPVLRDVLKIGKSTMQAVDGGGGIDARSLLAVPLVHGDTTIGVVCAWGREQGVFSEEQRQRLQSLARYAATSLANARYLEERQYRVEVLTCLQRLSLRVSGAKGMYPVASHVLRTAMEITNCSYGVIYHYDGQSSAVIPLAAPWEDADQTQTLIRGWLDAATVANLLDENQVRVWEQDTDQDEALLLVPLVREPHVSELLVLVFSPEHLFLQRDLEAMELLASQAVGHLENVTLYERLHAASHRMHIILNSTQDGMILLDRNEAVIDHNQAAERLLARDLHGVEGVGALLDGYEVVEDGAPPEMLERQYPPDQRDAVTRRELQRANADGQVTYLEQLELPVYDVQDAISGRLMVIRDITHEKEMLQQRREITSMLVHDLRGPLSSVLTGVQGALDALAPDNPDTPFLRAVLEAVNNSTERLLRLVSTLLDLEREQMSLDRERWSVSTLIEGAVDALQYTIQETGIRVQVDVSPDVPLLDVDVDKMQRVFINLIDNAIGYGEDVIRISVRQTDEHAVTIRIADDGPGIPADERAGIFDMYTQGDVERMRKTRNSGIGLAFCKRVVNAHGGSIEVVDGCELDGACIAFTLPAVTGQVE